MKLKDIFSKLIVHKLLWTFILITNLSKLVLVKGGFMTEPDESLYVWSFSFLKRLSYGNFSGALESLFSARGRPVEVFFKSIPASLQYFSSKIFHLNVLETKNMWVIFVFNFLIYFLILYYLYKISFLIFQNKNFSLFTILLYGSLTNSYVYLRHIYPYDDSLLVLILLTYLLLKTYLYDEKITYKKSFFFGFLAFLFFMFYPTFYMSFFALFFVFIWIVKEKTNGLKKFIVPIFLYVSGSFLTLIATEFIARSVGKSYVLNLFNLSGTINQGDYDESIIFILKYLLKVEGITGWFMLIGMFVFMYILLKMYNSKDRISRFVYVLFFSHLFFYFIHTGIFCQWQQWMTVYIRQMHQYMFLLAVFSVYALFKIVNKKMVVIMISLGILFTFQTIIVINNYLNIAYPRDIYWKYLRNTDRNLIKEVSEYKNSWSLLPTRFLENEKITNTKDTIIAVNTFYFFPITDSTKYTPYKPDVNYHLFFNKKHFLNFIPYQYEGYNRKERENINKIKFKIRLYKKKIIFAINKKKQNHE